MVKGEAPISVCPVGGAPVAAAIGAIMGQEAGAQGDAERKQWYGAPVRVTRQRTSMNTRVQGLLLRWFYYQAAVRRAAETDVLVLKLREGI